MSLPLTPNNKNAITIGIIGAGLAGLTSALLLRKYGYQVTIIEKKQFPFHRVCGEYVSNEVLPFLESLGLNIYQFNHSRINRLEISNASGRTIEQNLDLGGFGLSRYVLDNYLYQQAKAAGIEFIPAKVNNISFDGEEFRFDLSSGKAFNCSLAIAAYGKRSNLDQKLNRNFFYQRSPYLGVKYHIKTDLPVNLIRLDNFEGGYCGTCKIEDDLYNLCYLSETRNLKRFGSIQQMERSVLFKNSRLKRIFENSEFIFEKPEIINEISFSQKSPVEDHIFFCGDAAGMITPLCGNGMAMAIHSGKLIAECIIENGSSINLQKRLQLESRYKHAWQSHFSWRISKGRFIQNMFLNKHVNNLAFRILQTSPNLTNRMVRGTHGNPF
jgi:flavin-dependent dehydrogenase